MLVTEPDVALTDYALCLLGLFFAYTIAKTRTKSPHLKRALIAFFLTMSAASFLGGTVHGFFATKGTISNTILWTITMVNMGFVAFSVWLIAAEIIPKASRKAFVVFASTTLIFYEVIVLSVLRTFIVAIIFMTLASIVLLTGFVLRYWLERRMLWLYGIGGLLLTFVASGVQQLKISVHPVYFNHNALYHLIQAFALVTLFLVFKSILATEQAAWGKSVRQKKKKK